MNNYLSKGFKFLSDSNYRFLVLSTRGFYKAMNDKDFLCKMYKVTMNEELNINSPVTYNEKIQWLKLNDRKDIYSMMVDKYETKKYVSKIIGEEYIIPTIGIYNKFEEIDFNQLPDKFVMKCTHDSGGIVICKNKSKLNLKKAKKKINKSLKQNYFYYGREWPYKNVKPRIIIEKYMEDQSQKNILDYKFFCFGGKVECLYISEGSHSNNQKLQFYDKNFNLIDCTRKDYKKFEVLPQKPINFNKMIEFSEVLSKNIEHIRVDFYEINGKLYFSELTFYTGSGYIPWVDKKWDYEFGKMINLDNVIKRGNVCEENI